MNEEIRFLKEKLEKLSERATGETNEDFSDILNELLEEYEILKEEYHQISDDIIPEFPAYPNDINKSNKIDEKMSSIRNDFERKFEQLKVDLDVFDPEGELDMMFPDRHEYPEDYDDMFSDD